MAVFKIHSPDFRGVFNGAFRSETTDFSDGMGQEMKQFLFGILKELGLFGLSAAGVGLEKLSGKAAERLFSTKLGQKVFGPVLNSNWNNARKIKGVQNKVGDLTSVEFDLNFDLRKFKKILNKHGLTDYSITIDKEKKCYVVHYSRRDQELFEKCVKQHYNSFSNAPTLKKKPKFRAKHRKKESLAEKVERATQRAKKKSIEILEKNQELGLDKVAKKVTPKR